MYPLCSWRQDRRLCEEEVLMSLAKGAAGLIKAQLTRGRGKPFYIKTEERQRKGGCSRVWVGRNSLRKKELTLGFFGSKIFERINQLNGGLYFCVCVTGIPALSSLQNFLLSQPCLVMNLIKVESFWAMQGNSESVSGCKITDAMRGLVMNESASFYPI